MTTTAAETSEELRVLFCIGVLPEFYAQRAADCDRLMVLDQLMTIRVDGHRMWRYAKVEACVGPPLTFGRS